MASPPWRARTWGSAASAAPRDRGRFNRTRYNAEMVVASFTARLRQTVDLDTMQAELLSTVHHAFQPAHVSIWSAAKNRR